MLNNFLKIWGKFFRYQVSKQKICVLATLVSGWCIQNRINVNSQNQINVLWFDVWNVEAWVGIKRISVDLMKYFINFHDFINKFNIFWLFLELWINLLFSGVLNLAVGVLNVIKQDCQSKEQKATKNLKFNLPKLKNELKLYQKKLSSQQ